MTARFVSSFVVSVVLLGGILLSPRSGMVSLVHAKGSSAASLSEWRKGMALYNAYEFAKASAVIKKVVQHPPARWKRIDKAYALVILSVCQLNLANIKLATRIYEDALTLSRGVMLPPNLPENIKARYAKTRASWMKRNPLRKKNTVSADARKKALAKKRKQQLAKLRKKLKKRKVAKLKSKKPKGAMPFRYPGTVVVFCLVGAALASAIGLGVVSNSFNKAAQLSPRDAPDSANTINGQYQSALQTGIAATAMWIAVPVLGGVGVGVLIYESRKTLRRKQAALPPVPGAALAGAQGNAVHTQSHELMILQ